MVRMMFLVLVLCGAVCMLASLGIFTYLYHLHAAQFEMMGSTGDQVAFKFGIFAGLPSLIVFCAGAGLVVAGIKIGQRE